MKYFFIGLSLPNATFWVNLRPDSPDNIIDDYLAKTDVGKIMLETDLQLKKDTAQMTSPQTPEGREYWNKLYQKAGELFGNENINIPTLTRPWIVPDEIIIRETIDSAYIYKATLKVMLEQDYLKSEGKGVEVNYTFKDERLKALNEYSSQLIRELIIPKLTKAINTSKRYAPLRQIYYSLILAQWFKARNKGLSPSIIGDTLRSRVSPADGKGTVPDLIDSKDLTNLTSKDHWSKTTYYQAYQRSFKEGEYNIKEPVYAPAGQVIRSYFSGGEMLNIPPNSIVVIPANTSSPLLSQKFQIGKNFLIPLLLAFSLSFNSDQPNRYSTIAAVGQIADSETLRRKQEKIDVLKMKVEGPKGLSALNEIAQIIIDKQYSDETRIRLIKYLANILDASYVIWSVRGVSAEVFADKLSIEMREMALKILLNLLGSEEIIIRNSAIRVLKGYANLSVLKLRHAHLNQRISNAELEKRLEDLTLNNPNLLYICYTSQENFGDLANMILQRLRLQVDHERKDLLNFLKEKDPKGAFYIDFILQTANFSHLKYLLSSPKTLTYILNSLLKDLSESDILKNSVRLALFFESVIRDKNFGEQENWLCW